VIDYSLQNLRSSQALMMKSGELKSQADSDVLQELAAVLDSHELHGSHRAQTLLRYLVENALSHRTDQLKERTIGIELFHRDAAYDTGHDGIVRVAASDVRKRLMNFYSRTASTRTSPGIRIVLPSGSYVPVFERDEFAAPVLKESREQSSMVSGGESRRQLWVATGLVLLGVGIGAAIALVSAGQTATKLAIDPVLMQAWRSFARLDANVLLSTATPLSLVMVPQGHETYGSLTYPAPSEAYPLFRQHRPLVPGARLDMTFTDNMLGVGTMNAVVTAVNTLRSMGSSYQILPERVATLSALRGRNAILFGAPVDSEAISRTMEHTPLIVDYEPSVKGFVIRDRTSGQMIVPQKDGYGDFIDVYGLVTVLNARDSDRGHLGMVVLSGITSAGTHGAAEFFSSPRALRNLRAIFAREGVNGFPAAYQVVVRCTFSNLLLLAYEYHSHRILQKE
jgi:hypothetical protein